MRKLIAGLVLSLGLMTGAAADVSDIYPGVDKLVLMKLYLNSEARWVDGDRVILIETKVLEELDLTQEELHKYQAPLVEIYNAE